MPPFARRFPTTLDRVDIRITGDVRQPMTLGPDLADVSRSQNVSDFHCVTTWSVRGLRWEGIRFCDLFDDILVPQAGAPPDADLIVFRGQDGYRAALPLADLRAPDVLLADRLDGQPLSVAHGAPIRLVAPAHYGYKSVKHLREIRVVADGSGYREIGPGFLTHPRGRVALEERSRSVRPRLLRWLYRPMIPWVAARFGRSLREWEAGRKAS
ncbi:MAG: molybdopterin-dependent oxidoreductase [Bacteroidota bacterium]